MPPVTQTEAATTMTSDELPEDTDEDEDAEISKDELFHILQNERRRRVLQYVVNREGPFEMRAIAEQVAAWEHDTTVRMLTSDERQRVYIALYQSHLSKLDDAGLIEYQQSRGIVEVTDAIDVVKPHIDGIEDDEVADDDAEGLATLGGVDGVGQFYYEGATLLALVLAAGVWSNVIPESVISQAGLAAVVIGLFSVVAGVNFLHHASGDAE